LFENLTERGRLTDDGAHRGVQQLASYLSCGVHALVLGTAAEKLLRSGAGWRDQTRLRSWQAAIVMREQELPAAACVGADLSP
jgi:hypothetical protein